MTKEQLTAIGELRLIAMRALGLPEEDREAYAAGFKASGFTKEDVLAAIGTLVEKRKREPRGG